MDSKEIAIVKDFIAAINEGNLSKLSSLMAVDHTFVDSSGKAISGRDDMTKGWAEYFCLFPDYRIEVENVLQQQNLVAVFGSASGTYNGKRGLVKENIIEMPAAWRAIVKGGKIRVWQVYADWTEGYKITLEDEEKR